MREKSRASVLVGLSVTSQGAAHREILFRSMLRQSAAVLGLSTVMYRLVSSANSRILEPISVTMSLIYNKRAEGLKLNPVVRQHE